MLTGPQGGLFALAFGAGATGGYGFAIRTMYKIAANRITELKVESAEKAAEAAKAAEKAEAECARRIANLETRQKELEDMLLGRRAIGAFTAAIPTPPQPLPGERGILADIDRVTGG